MKDDLIDGNRGSYIDPTKYPQMKCDKCGHNVFRSGTVIYDVPGVVAGNGGENIPYPVPVYICDKCGEIIKFVRDELNKIETNKENNKSTSNLIL